MHAAADPDLLRALLVALLQDEGLGQQHPGHRHKGNQQQEELQAALAGKHLVLGALAAAVDVPRLRGGPGGARQAQACG
jgi:hypothetical protein